MRIAALISSFLTLVTLAVSPIGAAAAQVTNTPNHKLKDGTSTNWSGYVAETNLKKPANGAVTDVKGQWTVPAFSCAATGYTYSSVWVGIDGYTNGTVEQTGTEQDCNYGATVSYAWYELYPKYPVRISLPAFPGQVMSAEVRASGSNQYILTIAI